MFKLSLSFLNIWGAVVTVLMFLSSNSTICICSGEKDVAE